MQLGWIDFSKEDRQKALDVINLLSEQGAVDELGIGIVRDAFANYFFPGTSTIQTRAKYFLIVPYVLREAVDGRYGKDVNRILRAIDSAEKDCGIRLLEADPKAEGVIGSRVLPKGWVARKPSDIYWNGIRTFAKVFVNNFNLPESTAIIDLAYGRCRDDNSHWQNVLKYCKDGCFQAMIDEYIHMLKETAGFQSDGNQYQIVHDMMMDSLKIHTATYIADTYPDFKKRINGADRKSDGCRIRSSYAVGFTKDAGDNSKVVMRKENIRNAFNSPMRPFVLATTSIGQEGLDFHNYCRVIMHWNLPSNPIDVGRILRTFKIKKNVEVTDNGKDNF